MHVHTYNIFTCVSACAKHTYVYTCTVNMHSISLYCLMNFMNENAFQSSSWIWHPCCFVVLLMDWVLNVIQDRRATHIARAKHMASKGEQCGW